MNGLIQAMVLGVLRNGAAALGAWLLSQGYVNASTEQNVIGSICCLGAVAFTVIDKMAVKKSLVATAATGEVQPVKLASIVKAPIP